MSQTKKKDTFRPGGLVNYKTVNAFFNPEPVREAICVIEENGWKMEQYEKGEGWQFWHKHDAWEQCVLNNYEDPVCLECPIGELQEVPKVLLTHAALQKLAPKPGPTLGEEIVKGKKQAKDIKELIRNFEEKLFGARNCL